MGHWFLNNRQALAWHACFEVAAYIIGFRYYLYLQRNQQDKLTIRERALILVAGLIGALLGSRGLAFAENLLMPHPATHQLYWILANKTIVGGLLGALVTIEIAKKIYHIRYSSGDLMTYPLLLGLIIGRIGCFGASLIDNTYGYATSLPWAIDFGDGIMRHPTNLYEIVFLVALWGILFCFREGLRKVDGLLFKLFLLSYLIFRLFIDFLKPYPILYGHLSVIQWACLSGIIYYTIVIIYSTKKSLNHA